MKKWKGVYRLLENKRKSVQTESIKIYQKRDAKCEEFPIRKKQNCYRLVEGCRISDRREKMSVEFTIPELCK